LSAALFTLGLALTAHLAVTFYLNDYSLAAVTNNLGVTGLLLMIIGFMTFTFTLILHSTAVAVRK